MKAFILSIFLIIASTASVNADWKLSTSAYQSISMDAEAIVQQGCGLQAALHYKSGYLYISDDILPVRFGGQRGVDISLWSAGFGFSHKISEHFTFSCDAGWYEPVFKEEGKPQIFRLEDGTHAPQTHLAEGLWLYLNDYWAMDNRNWDYYTLDYHGSIGGKLNIAFSYPVCEWLSLDMAGSYRYLQLPERIRGKDYGNDIAFWALKQDRDFSGWLIGVGVSIIF